MEVQEVRDYYESLTRQQKEESAASINHERRLFETRLRTELKRTEEVLLSQWSQKVDGLKRKNSEMEQLNKDLKDELEFLQSERDSERDIHQREISHLIASNVVESLISRAEIISLHDERSRLFEDLAEERRKTKDLESNFQQEQQKMAADHEMKLGQMRSMLKAEKMRHRISVRARSISSDNNSLQNSSLISQSEIEEQNDMARRLEEMKRLEEAVRNKDRAKREILSWLKEFEAREGRKPTAEEKNPVRHLYASYNHANDIIKSIEERSNEFSQQPSVILQEEAPPRPSSGVDVASKKISAENAALRSEITQLRKTIVGKVEETHAITVLKEELAAITKDKEGLKERLIALRRAGKRDSDTLQTEARLQEITQEVEKLRGESAELEVRLKAEMNARKKLHNALQDVKGKIRVFCRIRPASKVELEQRSRVVVTSLDDYSVVVDTRTGQKSFNFDSVFGPTSTQDQVFEDSSQLVRSFLDGYNVCVFAYGQTGSGKTYTMQGTKDHPGLTPKVIKEVFVRLEELRGTASWELSVSMLELYMDNIVDLLAAPKDPRKAQSSLPLDIREDVRGGVYVANAVVNFAETEEELHRVLKQGLLNRKVGRTDMNEESSRSHLVITLTISLYNKTTDARTTSKFSLIDLAGSERVSKAGTSAKQMNEAKSINKSLTALGDVISSLANATASSKSFIPYRNNKLTMLMKDSLGGNAKTLMFVNVSPVEYNVEESIMSLSYATRVKSITNESVKNVESKDIMVLREKLRAVVEERDHLRKIVESSGIVVEEHETEEDLRRFKTLD
eukprot:TRINITY_DN3924_c0_g2_i10.p1 TRINITY_DN3924_c0_g2~~TRINITY_DN3924_c0_g2_i10.p1  ORF type:complete len:797 (+),score=221.75 TRINITY_DN3924_c0_g2_i10:558-2948(+)